MCERVKTKDAKKLYGSLLTIKCHNRKFFGPLYDIKNSINKRLDQKCTILRELQRTHTKIHIRARKNR